MTRFCSNGNHDGYFWNWVSKERCWVFPGMVVCVCVCGGGSSVWDACSVTVCPYGHRARTSKLLLTVDSTGQTCPPAFWRRVPTRKPSPWFSLLRCDLLSAKRERCQAERQWLSICTGKLNMLLQLLVPKAKSLFYTAKITEAKSTEELYHITNRTSARARGTQLPSVFPLSYLSLFWILSEQNQQNPIWS